MHRCHCPYGDRCEMACRLTFIVEALITLKDICNLISTKPFVVIGVDLQNELCNLLILFSTISRLRIKVLAIVTPVDAQDPAEKLDVMLEEEFMYRI